MLQSDLSNATHAFGIAASDHDSGRRGDARPCCGRACRSQRQLDLFADRLARSVDLYRFWLQL